MHTIGDVSWYERTFEPWYIYVGLDYLKHGRQLLETLVLSVSCFASLILVACNCERVLIDCGKLSIHRVHHPACAGGYIFVIEKKGYRIFQLINL